MQALMSFWSLLSSPQSAQIRPAQGRRGWVRWAQAAARSQRSCFRAAARWALIRRALLSALLAAGQRIDWVAGISIGAINGAIICGNPPERRVERLSKFFRPTSSAITTAPFNGQEVALRLFDETSAAITATFGAPGFFRPRRTTSPARLFFPAGEVEFLRHGPVARDAAVGSVDFDLLNSGATPFSIGAVNVRTGIFLISTRRARG